MLRRKKRSEHSLLHSVEEATELLRRCGVEAWVWWFAGSTPFAIGLLHFTSDMSRAATAEDHLAGSALLLALLYWWMKVAQAVFSDRLLRQLRGEDDPPRLPWRGRLRFITSQALIHATAPWVLPLSIVAMLPFGWAYAAYHNVSALSLSVFRAGGRTRDLIRTALVQSNYRQGQNHGLISILLVFSGVVFLNWMSGALLAASLASIFTGEENAISRNPMMMLSTGMITAMLAASYLVVGPFVKALYVLRCFYSLSRRNGEDIETAFRATGLPAAATIALLCCALPAVSHASVSPAESGLHEPARPAPFVRPDAPSRIDPGALQHQIHKVIQQDIFQWRMPRDLKRKIEEKGWLENFIDDVNGWIKKAGDEIGQFFDRLLKDRIKNWLRDLMGQRHDHEDQQPATPWADTVDLLLKVLVAALVVIVSVLLIRQWRRQPPAPARADATPEVNLENENVVATQLPENEWLRMADEKINSGEFRLAMRALFLATLAHLSDRKLLAVVKSKSNGDYVRELTLRARDRQVLRGRFGDSVRVFDWAWYGWHEVTRELLDQCRDNHQHIISDAR